MNYLYPDYAKWQSRFAALALGMVRFLLYLVYVCLQLSNTYI
jgi:hypothetical protein